MNQAMIEDIVSTKLNANESNVVVEIPENAPFDPQQRQWLNGLLTGINTLALSLNSQSAKQPSAPLKIFFGSQSGNGDVLSKKIKKYANARNFDADVSELNDITLEDLSTHSHVLIVCSTFGEGEAPDNAKQFYSSLMSDSAPSMPASLHFSVCALGDSSYKYFNKVGINIYNRLQELGATPCHDLAVCDVDFEDDFTQWQERVFESESFKNVAGANNEVPAEYDHDEPKYNKNTPFIANLIQVDRLSSEQSAKRVNHIEISLAGTDGEMNYHVGDALGVWPLNCANEVADILKAGGFTGKERVKYKNTWARLQVLLQNKLDIHTVNKKGLDAWGLADVPEGYQVLDVLEHMEANMDAQKFVSGLRALQPRLYSIASSPKKHPGEVHLTIGEVHYSAHNRERKGVASNWLSHRLSSGANLGVYIQPSEHFHITSDDQAPIIMIGPGTGIAPFRAFLEEREMRQATGDNWLFFGDQHEAHDFLYQDEIDAWHTSGLLNNVSLAWSRDTDKKVYVQTLIKKQGKEFFEWLENGAYIYICGDASKMASDVDATIKEVIAEHSGLDSQAYIDKLISEHRYQRDVY